jgi:Ca2+-binding EF-hand superfamily protein
LLALVISADTNQDGHLSFEEVQAAMPRISQTVFAYMDVTGDGFISLADLVASPIVGQVSVVAQVIALADADYDGQVTLDDIRAVYPALPEADFQLLDINGDGVVSQSDIRSEDPDDPSDPQNPEDPENPENPEDPTHPPDPATDPPMPPEPQFPPLPAPLDTVVDWLDQYAPVIAAHGVVTWVELEGGFYGIVTEDGEQYDPVNLPGSLQVEGLVISFVGVSLTELDGGDIDSADRRSDPAGVLLPEVGSVHMWGMLIRLVAVDLNNDGMIDLGELILDTPPSPSDPPMPPCIPVDRLVELFHRLDADDSGGISLDELRTLIPDMPEALFVVFDPNGDGMIDAAEAEQLVVNLPFSLAPALEYVDTDGDQAISFEEAVAVVPELSPDVFQALDRNGDGVISADDPFCFESPPMPPCIPVNGLVDLFHRLDADDSGSISLDELRTLIPDMPEALFVVFDPNGDGVIDAAEAEQLVVNLPFSLAPALEYVDTNGDQAISFEEAVAVMPELSPDVFQALDRNGDGVISAEDAFCFQPPPTPPDPGTFPIEWFEATDTNEDGVLSYDEVAARVPGFSSELFDLADFNDDGVLNLDEIVAVVYNPGRALEALLDLADADDDGALSLAEIQTLIPEFPEDLFEMLDRNEDDLLSPVDLTSEPPEDWPRPPVDAGPVELLLWLLRVADADHDGTVTQEEALVLFPDASLDVFADLDRNQDGVLSLDDLPEPPVPDMRILEILELADADGDGVVTLDELLAVLPDLAEARFNELDTNDDGVLSRDDLPGPPPEDSNARLLYLLREADADQDGIVTWEEVLAFLPEFTQNAFAFLDRNGDGELSSDDLLTGPPPGLRERLLRLLRYADQNNDGVVTTRELGELVPELTLGEFNRLDSNGDSVLSSADLPPSDIEPVERLLHVLNDADIDGDGVVTFEEVAAVIPDLTPEQFAQLDLNGDGVLSRDDVAAATNAEDGSVSHLISLLAEADTDGSQDVTFEELAVLAPDLSQETFSDLDSDGDGVISPGDIPEPVRDPRDQFLEWLREADNDPADAQVSYEELSAVLPDLTAELFDVLDADDDDVLTLADLPALPIPIEDSSRLRLVQTLVSADANEDGVLSFDEVAGAFPDAPAELLSRIDVNDDWVLTRTEIMAALSQSEVSGGALVEPSDIDADGSMTAADIQIAVNHVLGSLGSVLPPDVNGDGYVNATDIQLIVNALLGRV